MEYKNELPIRMTPGGVWNAIGNEIGKSNLQCIMKALGGEQVYIPSPEAIIANVRKKRIREAILQGRTANIDVKHLLWPSFKSIPPNSDPFTDPIYDSLANEATPNEVPDPVWRIIAEEIGTYNLIRFLAIFCCRFDKYRNTYIPKPRGKKYQNEEQL